MTAMAMAALLSLGQVQTLPATAGDPDATAAANCPALNGNAKLAAADPRARLLFIRDSLKRERTKALWWSWGFGGLFTAITLYSVEDLIVPTASDTKGKQQERVNDAVTGGVSLLPPLLLLVAPLDVMEDALAVERMADQPPGDGSDRCAVLAKAEEIFAYDADGEAQGVALWDHALNLAVNAVAGLALGIFVKRWDYAALTGGGGFVLGEAQILLQPDGAESDLAAYKEGKIGSAPAAPAISLHWMVAPTDHGGGQLTMAGRF